MKMKLLKKTVVCLCVAGLFFVLTKNLVKRHKADDAGDEQYEECIVFDQSADDPCVVGDQASDLSEKVHATERQKRDFFTSIGCEYINHMDIPSELSELQDYKQSAHYKADPQTIAELSEKYRKDIQEKKLAPMFIKFVSDKVGYGIFALHDILSGDFIGVYAGDVRPMRAGIDQEPENVDYAWDYGTTKDCQTKDGQNEEGKRLILDGKYRSNDLRFINHACDPNTKAMYLVCDGQLSVCYVAQKDVAAGEQLTVSYGDDYWSTRNLEPESFT